MALPASSPPGLDLVPPEHLEPPPGDQQRYVVRDECALLLDGYLHAQAEWEQQPRHRDPVFARDGWRCAVPACTSRRNLHDHHLLFRSRSGGNARDNRITVCAWHHLRGIHQGRVRAWGTAPDDVTWELGLRSGCAPLLRLHGDEYLVER